MRLMCLWIVVATGTAARTEEPTKKPPTIEELEKRVERLKEEAIGKGKLPNLCMNHRDLLWQIARRELAHARAKTEVEKDPNLDEEYQRIKRQLNYNAWLEVETLNAKIKMTDNEKAIAELKTKIDLIRKELNPLPPVRKK